MIDYVFAGWFAGLIVASYIGGKILAPILDALVSRIVITTKTSLDDRILSELREPFESFFFLFVAYAGLKLFPQFSAYGTVVDTYVASVLILVVTYMTVRVMKAFFRWYYEEGYVKSRIKIDLSLIPFLQKLSRLVVAIIGIAFAIAELGFDISGIVTVTSIAGVIIGLASQESLANIFAGLALQMDRPYVYGDFLQLPTGETVRIRKIGIRSSKMIDVFGNEVILSNSEFAKLKVIKVGKARTKTTLQVIFEAPVDIDADEVAEQLAKQLNSKKPEGISLPCNLKIVISRVIAPQKVQGLVLVDIDDMIYGLPISSEVNRILGKILFKK